MENNNQQSIDPRTTSRDAGTSGSRVIQPSASFIQELKAAPVAPTPRPQPSMVAQQSQPAAPASTLYPEATNGIGASAPEVSASQPANDQGAGAKSPSKVLTVRVVASVIVLLNALNLYDWLLEQRGGFTNWISLLEIVVMTALAVGIFKLSDFARSLYVTLSAISLVLSCVGLLIFFVSTHHVGSLQASQQSLTRAQLETSLKAAEDNTSLPAQARQEDIQQLQREISGLSGSSNDLKVKQFASTAILIITAVGPLVLFTRPSVKEAFS